VAAGSVCPVVTYVSLSLPYDQLQFAYIAHNILQSVLGFLLSIPLRQAFKATWNWSATTRVIIAVLLILILATVWAAMRLELLIVIAGETDLWDDFGGFLFPSLFVFSGLGCALSSREIRAAAAKRERVVTGARSRTDAKKPSSWYQPSRQRARLS
jgi:hypothetical protein